MNLNRLKKAVLLTRLARALRSRGSWCGETHLQKAVYYLQALLKAPMGYGFILYRHGPFSFDLRDELSELRADGLLELEPKPYPYGPSLVPTAASRKLERRFPTVIEKHKKKIEFVAKILGRQGVIELERLGTALYLIRKMQGEDEKRAARIHQLKPHISVADARQALAETRKIMAGARAL